MTEVATDVVKFFAREYPTPVMPDNWEDVLERAGAGRQLRRGHARWLTRRRLVAIAVTALLAALLVTPALGIGSRLLDLIQGAPPPRETREPSWSPDGRKVAYVSRRDHNSWELYVINIDGSGQRMLASVASASSAWSPDGRKLAFQQPGSPRGVNGRVFGRDLSVINTDGTGQRWLERVGYDPAWSPDGRKIVFAASSRIYVVNTDGSGLRRLAGNTVPGSGKAGKTASPVWSPDGRKVLFLSAAGTHCDYCFHVYVMNADGSGQRQLTDHATPQGDSSPTWSPDGRRIAFVTRRLAQNGWGLGEVWVLNADTGQRHKLARETSVGRYARVAWSPDGRKLAFTSDRDGNAEVYSINADGSGLRRLTNSPEFDGDATWSPDGRRIVFVSNRGGDSEVYVMNADGSGQRNLSR